MQAYLTIGCLTTLNEVTVLLWKKARLSLELHNVAYASCVKVPVVSAGRLVAQYWSKLIIS